MIIGTAAVPGRWPPSWPPTASSVAMSLTSSAPMPGGPPSLCAATTRKSASGSGSLPALCAQSASSSPPAARHPRGDLGDRMDDAGLVVDRLDRDQRPLRAGQRRVEIGEVERAVGARPRSAARRARCAAPPDARSPRRCAVPPWRGARTISIASVAPEVKMRVPSQPSAAAIRRRALLHRGARRRGLRHGPRRGWPRSRRPRAIAAAASGRIGVVEAWSR